MTIRFNIPCTVEKRGAADLYGQEQKSAPVPEWCQVVKLEPRVQHSTVRTDSSATRGRAMEDRADAVLLIRPNSSAEIEDFITVNKVKLRVMEKRARFTVTGILDHYQITCESA